MWKMVNEDILYAIRKLDGFPELVRMIEHVFFSIFSLPRRHISFSDSDSLTYDEIVFFSSLSLPIAPVFYFFIVYFLPSLFMKKNI